MTTSRADLNILDLPSIFQNLADNSRSGILKVEGEGGKRFLRFDKGGILMVYGPWDDPLKDALLRSRVVSQQTLSDAIGGSDASTSTQVDAARLVRTLARGGAASRSDIEAAVRFHIMEGIWELFTWKDLHCEFGLERVENGYYGLPFSGDTISPMPVVMEACRRVDEWELIKEALPSLKDIPILEGDLAKLVDRERHRLVAEAIDSTADIGELLERVHLSRFEALLSLKELKNEGLVRLRNPEELLQLAHEIRRLGHGLSPKNKLEKIVRIYERGEELGLKSSKIGLWLARSYERTGRPEEAYERYHRLATRMVEDGRAEDAADLLARAVELQPENLLLREDLVRARVRCGDHRGAAHEAIRILNELAEAERLPDALKLGRELHEVLPEHAGLLRTVAELCVQAGEPIQAMINYELLAELYRRQNRPRQAIQVFERLLELDGENLNAHFQLAEMLTALGRTKEAVERYRTLAGTLQGSALSDSINWQFLANVYERLVAIEEDDPEPREWLVEHYLDSPELRSSARKHLHHLRGLYRAGSDPERHRRALWRLLDLEPEDRTLRLELAGLLGEADQGQEAARQLLLVAASEEQEGRCQGALETVGQALRLAPHFVDARQRRVRLLLKDGQVEEAAEELLVISFLERARGALPGAVASLKRSLELAPDHPERRLLHADLLHRAGARQEALDQYLALARSYLEDHSYGEVRRLCRKVLEMEPDAGWARSLLERIDQRLS